MGVNQSRVNISKPITLNRIRAECQVDPNTPHELKQYYADLLANDLNALGFEIPIEHNGKKRSPSDICNDIRKATLPDVEAICMSGSDKKGKETDHVIKLVNHFNKHYSARIPIHTNPLNPKSPKRSVYDMCEDLYLVADKMRNSIDDHPKVVKEKLQAMIDELEYKRNQIQGQFGSLMTSLQRSKNDDKMTEKLKVARSMQNAMNSALDSQVRNASENFGELITELKETVKQNDKSPENLGSGLQGLSGQGPGLGLGLNNNLQQLNMLRDGNTEKNKERIALLMEAMKNIDASTSGCTNCLNKFGLSLARYNEIKDDTAKLNKELGEKFRRLFLTVDTKNKAAVNEILSCYNSLLNDQNMCGDNESRTISSTLNQQELTKAFSNVNDLAILVNQGLNYRRKNKAPVAGLGVGTGTVST